MNILITNIGRRGYLVDYFREAITPNEKIYTSDCDATASGLYGNNDGFFILPKPVDDEKKYVTKLMNLCIDKDIKLVVPVIDPEIFILSAYKDQFYEKGIIILVSDRKVLDICYDKELMNDFLLKNSFLVPKSYYSLSSFENDYNKSQVGFPVYLKPIKGSGSVETYKVDNFATLRPLFHDGMMIQECLIGNEYGVDTLNTFSKSPVRCVIKRKVSMRSGETDKSITVENTNIQNLFLLLAKKLGHIGNLDADVIETTHGLYVIDLNPRFGGGYPATYAAGENYPSLIIKMIKGESVEENFDGYAKNLLVMKEIKIRTHQL